MKKFALLVLIATTVSYCAQEGKDADTNIQRKQTSLTRALENVDATHKAAGFFAIASFGNLFKSRPIIAVPICVLSVWQAFIPKAVNTPSLQANFYDLFSIAALWGNKISRKINAYKTQLQKDENNLQKQPLAPTTPEKNSEQK
jgi:hypothetical protein